MASRFTRCEEGSVNVDVVQPFHTVSWVTELDQVNAMEGIRKGCSLKGRIIVHDALHMTCP